MNLKIHINKQIGSNNILNTYTTEMFTDPLIVSDLK